MSYHMGQTTCDTIETLLASVQEGVEDSELNYKLRTARSLIHVCKEDVSTLEQALNKADLDDEMLENLRQLGYLE